MRESLAAALERGAEGPPDDIAWLRQVEASLPGRSAELPFAHLFAGLAHGALDECMAQWPDEHRGAFAESARAGAVSWLLNRLSLVSVRLLMSRLEPGSARERANYAHLCRSLARERLEPLRSQFPAWATLVDLVLDSWARALTEFVQRICIDESVLAGAFGSAVPARIERIRLASTQSRQGGRVTLFAELAGSAESVDIIYKTRDLSIERAFVQLACSVLPDNRTLQSVTVLPVAETHGYVNVLRKRECAIDELPDFYRQCGRLLAFMYAVSVDDGHMGNVLACGVDPVPIDVESWLSGTGPMGRRSERPTVMQVGMVPAWRKAPASGAPMDSTALGVQTSVENSGRIPGILDMNTDGMRAGATDAAWQDIPSLPRPSTEPNPLARYAEELIGGFEDGYGRVLSQRDRIAQRITDCRGFSARALGRPMRLYSMIAFDSLSAEWMESVADRETYLLARLATSPVVGEGFQPTIADEAAALMRCDLPYWTARVGDATSDYDHLAAVLARLEALGSQDCAVQVHHIRRAIASRWPGT